MAADDISKEPWRIMLTIMMMKGTFTNIRLDQQALCRTGSDTKKGFRTLIRIQRMRQRDTVTWMKTNFKCREYTASKQN